MLHAHINKKQISKTDRWYWNMVWPIAHMFGLNGSRFTVQGDRI